METFKKWIEENRITEVECLIPDITGNARGKIMPAKKFLREGGMHLPEVIFFQTVNGDWPDDESMIDLTEKDMNLEPDPNTVRLVPWTKDPTGQVIHDCFTVDGEPVEVSPRAVLRRVLSFYEREGWNPIVAPELEFFLVKKIWTGTIRLNRRLAEMADQKRPDNPSVSML